MNTRDKIFKRIKAVREAKNLEAEAVEAPKASGLKVSDGDLAEIFKKSLELVQGECYFSDNQEVCFVQVMEYIEKNGNINNVFISPSLKSTPFSTLAMSEEDLSTVRVGISTCELLVAHTGTALVTSKEGRRIIGLSPIHIIIAERSQLRSTLDEGVKELAQKYGEELPSQITLITGPSRTADIEKTLILGAHGPKKLAVFIY